MEVWRSKIFKQCVCPVSACDWVVQKVVCAHILSHNVKEQYKNYKTIPIYAIDDDPLPTTHPSLQIINCNRIMENANGTLKKIFF